MASDLFKGQDFRLTLASGIDLTGATVTRILYNSPSGKKGSWAGTQDGNSVYYDVTSIQNNESGVWSYQLYVEINGKKYYGEVVKKHSLPNIT